MTSAKIQPCHQQRQAYIYIRQSSLQQVEHNLESRDLQYQLAHRAQALGWHAEQVTIIDEDLGKSAATTNGRAGFQTLAAAVGMGQVGEGQMRSTVNCGRTLRLWSITLSINSSVMKH